MRQKKNILPENTIEIFEFSRQKIYFFFANIFTLQNKLKYETFF